MGRTARFASVNGYYLLGRHNFPHGADAYLMYCGTLLFLVSMITSLLGAMWALPAYYQP